MEGLGGRVNILKRKGSLRAGRDDKGNFKPLSDSEQVGMTKRGFFFAFCRNVVEFCKINTNIYFHMKKFLRTVSKEFRWGIFFGFAIFIAGVCFAATASTVGMENRTEGGSLSATEFNTILKTLFGLRNNNGDLGIGMNPVTGIKLSVNGMMRVRPKLAGDCENGNAYKGRIYFDTTEKHFYVCRGTASNDWVQLDNEEGGGCTPNCTGKDCGSDQCGGICGTCTGGETCNATGTCASVTCSSDTDCTDSNSCTDDTCSNAGTSSSSCSHSNNTYSTSCSQAFGTCSVSGTKTCSGGSYGSCTGATDPRTANCSGKDCGSDQCGGICGTCTGGETCNATGTCETACTPVDGAWSAWSPWECVMGASQLDIAALRLQNLTASLFMNTEVAYNFQNLSRRTRSCNNPCGGVDCIGEATQTNDCYATTGTSCNVPLGVCVEITKLECIVKGDCLNEYLPEDDDCLDFVWLCSANGICELDITKVSAKTYCDDGSIYCTDNFCTFSQ